MAHQKYIDAPNTSPLPATRDTIKAQATAELKLAALDYARGRVKLLRWAGRPVSAMSARELVEDVLADTWAGDLPWAPSQCSLLEHFRQAIKQRTWLEIRHANRISFVPLPDAANEEAAPDRLDSDEVEQALAATASDRPAPSRWRAMLEATCRELRARVECSDAAALVECWADGVTERHAIQALTGLTDAAYERARKRLLYVGRNLSAELREFAHDLLRGAS